MVPAAQIVSVAVPGVHLLVLLALRPRASRWFATVAGLLLLTATAAAFGLYDSLRLVANRPAVAALAAALAVAYSWRAAALMLLGAVLVAVLGDHPLADGLVGLAAGSVCGLAALLLRKRLPAGQERRYAYAATALALAAAALAAPRLLVTSGTFWTAQEMSILPALTLATVVAAALLGVAAYGAAGPPAPAPAGSPPQPAHGGTTDRLSAIATAVGLVVAVTALSGTIGNVPPPVGAVPGCEGVQIHSVPFLGETPPDGANARAAATSISEQRQRLGGHCSVGVLGYCRGEPLYDTHYPVRDSRWYVLPHGLGLVSSTALLDLSAASTLKPVPCPGQLAPTGIADLVVEPDTAEVGGNDLPVLDIGATALDATNVGVAVHRPAFPPNARFRQLLLDSKPLDGATVPYDFTGDAKIVPGNTSVVVAATVCLAAGVPEPDGKALFMQVELPLAGHPFSAEPVDPPAGTRDLLLQAACRYQVDEGIPVNPATYPPDGL